MTIDGVLYRVRPGETRTLSDMPAGRVSYSVSSRGFGIGPLTRSRINANETLTIRVYDPGELDL